MLYIGVDLGTSSTKFILTDQKGSIVTTYCVYYPTYFPHPAWSEQDPENWWRACLEGIPRLLTGIDPRSVAGIGIGGQMHGLVVLDRQDKVIRPAILWNDSRTHKEVYELNYGVGMKKLSGWTGNIAFAGFTAPKLLWMRKNEPDLFDKIDKIMLPKDFLVYRLTGVHATDYSDASGTLLLDVAHRQWSREMLELCHITDSQMPILFESYAPVGKLRPEAAELLGLPQSVTVCAGAGDNAAVDSRNSLHSFAHADGGFHLMGCMLSAAACNKWWQEDILHTNNFKAEEENILRDKLGKNHVFFLPYLMGERSPINDTNARSLFIGMTMDANRADMLQAVLEGVAFAIRDSFEVARELGTAPERSNICGGGSRSQLWQVILSNILGIPLDTVKTSEGPGYGAAILAMVSCGEFDSVKYASDTLVKVVSTVTPDKTLTELYEERYQQFKRIYPVCKDLFQELL